MILVDLWARYAILPSEVRLAHRPVFTKTSAGRPALKDVEGIVEKIVSGRGGEGQGDAVEAVLSE